MRRRLVTVSLGVTSMVVFAFVLPLAVLVADLAHDRAISDLERDAQGLAATLAALQPLDAAGIAALVGDGRRLEGGWLAVVLPGGEVVGPDAVDTTLVADAGSDRAILRRPVTDGEAVAVPVVGEEGTLVVYGLAPTDLLREGVDLAWGILAGLGVFAVALSAVLADRLGRSMVGPVEALSRAARDWSAGRIEVRVEPSGPDEVADTGRAFNRLADRIVELLRMERESAADLSHRLRTPLTAIELDVDAVEDPTVRGRLQDDVAEMRRTVDHVIRQARRPVREGGGVVTDLAEVVRERTAFWQPLAEEQGRSWDIDIPAEPVPVRSHPEDLAAAVDALLGNVFAHTPEGAGCLISLTRTGTLVVEDGGSGFGADMIERGRSGGDSTGLGLDIVRQTATAHGGSMRIAASPLGGAAVEVRFVPIERD